MNISEYYLKYLATAYKDEENPPDENGDPKPGGGGGFKL